MRMCCGMMIVVSYDVYFRSIHSVYVILFFGSWYVSMYIGDFIISIISIIGVLIILLYSCIVTLVYYSIVFIPYKIIILITKRSFFVVVLLFSCFRVFFSSRTLIRLFGIGRGSEAGGSGNVRVVRLVAEALRITLLIVAYREG
jgi:hypothetical protein